MDSIKQKKPRTIKMKYPAPYSQSWTDNQNTGLSKKKSKLHNINQSVRSPPLSQSWANERITKKVKRKLPTTRAESQTVYPLSKYGVKSEKKIVRRKKSSTMPRRSSQKLSSDLFHGGPWSPAKPKVRGPDPTAPHLKYGLFPTPRKSANKSQMQVMAASGPETRSRTSTPEHSSKKSKKVKGKKGQLSEGEPPMFVFRALDPRYTRQLSVSTPTHVDIRPRTKAPTFGHQQTLQSSSQGQDVSPSNNEPTLSITPLKKSMYQVLPKKNIT